MRLRRGSEAIDATASLNDPSSSRSGRFTLLARVDRGAGAEGRYTDQIPQPLLALAQAARVESVTASSAIEGAVVADRRRDGLLQGTTRSYRNRSEADYAGASRSTTSTGRTRTSCRSG